MRRLLGLITALSLVIGVAACGDGDDSGAGTTSPPTVYAAASLTEVFPQIDAAPTYNFAGSDDLATQIREGAPADVYAAANAKLPQELRAEGLVDEPVTFASNRLVLIVPQGNPAGITEVGDVANDGVKLVIAAEGVPVGAYTRTVLDALDLNAALDNVVSNEDDVKGVVAKVALGEADAGFVYATDAAVADDVTVIDVPADAQPPIEYQIAVVTKTGNRAGAEAFVEEVLAEQGQDALRAAGFVVAE